MRKLRSRVKVECRHKLRREIDELGVVTDSQWSDLVDQAHREITSTRLGFAFPVGAIEPDGVALTAVFDGSLVRRFREWLKTENGQAFLAVLKKIAMALIASLIAGS